MDRASYLKPVYVQYIPPAELVKDGELYVSLEFQTAVHKCCCGCGMEVVTPFNPAQWRLSDRDGKVSIYPSIGNWSYPCQSHYFIRNNQIVWAEAYSAASIRRVQANDRRALDNYIASKNSAPQSSSGLTQRVIAVLRAFAKAVEGFFKGK